jgi:hypothetical protein
VPACVSLHCVAEVWATWGAGGQPACTCLTALQYGSLYSHCPQLHIHLRQLIGSNARMEAVWTGGGEAAAGRCAEGAATLPGQSLYDVNHRRLASCAAASGPLIASCAGCPLAHRLCLVARQQRHVCGFQCRICSIRNAMAAKRPSGWPGGGAAARCLPPPMLQAAGLCTLPC